MWLLRQAVEMQLQPLIAAGMLTGPSTRGLFWFPSGMSHQAGIKNKRTPILNQNKEGSISSPEEMLVREM